MLKDGIVGHLGDEVKSRLPFPPAAPARGETGRRLDKSPAYIDTAQFTSDTVRDTMRNRYTIIAMTALAVALFDQASKALVLLHVPLYTEIPVIRGFFNLVHVRNRGAAFGFLNRHDITWQFWLFLAASCVAVAVVYFLARTAREDDNAFFVALGLILGGAAGNLLDRVRFREVVDFLDFHYRNYHWPAFNVADIAICCGAILALLLSLRRRGPEPPEGKD